MRIITKDFNALELSELHDLMRLRSAVFVVEQNCIYQDIDTKDMKAYHVLMSEGKEIVGYARLIPPGASFNDASIGRVAVAKEQRGKGYGRQLMKYSIAECLHLFGGQTITISAQCYLERFYTDLGFKTSGLPYLEDTIPHVKMIFQKAL